MKAAFVASEYEIMDEIYFSENPVVRFVMANRLDSIAKIISTGKNLKILDAGCGTGHMIKLLHEKRKDNIYYGIDTSAAALQIAKERCPSAKLEIMDVSNIGFKDEFFDVVICTEVLEHMVNYQTAVREFKRVLKKNGCLIITFPNETLWTVGRFFLGKKPLKNPGHINCFTAQKVREFVKMNLILRANLPFRLPIWLSLGSMMEFQKK